MGQWRILFRRARVCVCVCVREREEGGSEALNFNYVAAVNC